MATVTDTNTASTVKVWEKRITDIANQTNLNATDIGSLQNDRGRLNVIGKLDATDKEDIFKFNALTPGKFSLGLETDADLHIQVLKLNGSRVIADSSPDMGAASDNFAAMSAGTFDLEPGSYLVKVSFNKGVTPAPIDYALQAKLGDSYPNDYITWESQASKTVEIPQPVMSPITDIFGGFIKTFKELFGFV